MIPVPPPTKVRNHSATLVAAMSQRLEAVRAAAGEGSDFVLEADARLTPGDASTLAAELERAHLLVFLPTSRAHFPTWPPAYRIAAEEVTPVGFGPYAVEAGVFQDLLRSDAIYLTIRADIALHGITRIRRIAALAETYYVAVAPFS